MADVVDGEIRITLKDAVAENEKVLLASYDEHGKMTSVTCGKNAGGNEWAFAVDDILEDAEWKLLYSDTMYQPVREALDIKLP